MARVPNSCTCPGGNQSLRWEIPLFRPPPRRKGNTGLFHVPHSPAAPTTAKRSRLQPSGATHTKMTRPQRHRSRGAAPAPNFVPTARSPLSEALGFFTWPGLSDPGNRSAAAFGGNYRQWGRLAGPGGGALRSRAVGVRLPKSQLQHHRSFGAVARASEELYRERARRRKRVNWEPTSAGEGSGEAEACEANELRAFCPRVLTRGGCRRAALWAVPSERARCATLR